jgi:hypothetical protein
MLTTNMVKKVCALPTLAPLTCVIRISSPSGFLSLLQDIGDQNQYVIGTAMNGLSEFMSPDLARDLASDIVALTASVRLL